MVLEFVCIYIYICNVGSMVEDKMKTVAVGKPFFRSSCFERDWHNGLDTT